MKVIQLYKKESELIKRALKNNRVAQHVLFEMHAPKMLSICRYYIKDLQQAEEAMLNGFFKVFTQLNTFRNEGSFEGWIRRIMVRESISYLRSKRSFEQLEEDLNEVVEAEKLVEFATALRDEFGYDFLSSVTGVDYLPDDKMEVV